MSLDDKKWMEQDVEYPEAGECIGKSTRVDNALPSYEYLYGLKHKIPKELFAYYFRRLLQYNTANVPVELRLKMFESVDRNDIMFQSELDSLRKLGESVTIYRGASSSEISPGLSWSLKKYIAENSDFYRGRLFVAEIPTSAILLYMSHEEDEEEIVAHVTSDYQIIDE